MNFEIVIEQNTTSIRIKDGEWVGAFGLYYAQIWTTMRERKAGASGLLYNLGDGADEIETGILCWSFFLQAMKKHYPEAKLKDSDIPHRLK